MGSGLRSPVPGRALRRGASDEPVPPSAVRPVLPKQPGLAETCLLFLFFFAPFLSVPDPPAPQASPRALSGSHDPTESRDPTLRGWREPCVFNPGREAELRVIIVPLPMSPTPETPRGTPSSPPAIALPSANRGKLRRLVRN